jgi:hypothetical protein
MTKKTNKTDKEEFVKTPELEMFLHNEFTDDQLEAYLTKGTIKPTDKPETPPQVLWVGDCTIATFGNFSASTGKAKSKKTFNVSAMVAAAMINGTVLKYRATLPENKRKIFYFDTEQSRYHCYKVLERILRLSGLPLDTDNDLIRFIGLREFTPNLRLSLIDYALRKSEGYGLVIIDGLRDLVYDINNAREATDVMTMLMAWTSAYNLHIHCVLHLNKNDSNTRGHIGTELENKAETVLVISKDKDNSEISQVSPMHMRDKEFSAFAFHVGENALPALDDDYQVTVVKPTKNVNLLSVPLSQHKLILEKVFQDGAPETYNELVAKVSQAYADNGLKRGMNAVKSLVAMLTSKGAIVKEGTVYAYYPDKLTSTP